MSTLILELTQRNKKCSLYATFQFGIKFKFHVFALHFHCLGGSGWVWLQQSQLGGGGEGVTPQKFGWGCVVRF